MISQSKQPFNNKPMTDKENTALKTLLYGERKRFLKQEKEAKEKAAEDKRLAEEDAIQSAVNAIHEYLEPVLVATATVGEYKIYKIHREVMYQKIKQNVQIYKKAFARVGIIIRHSENTDIPSNHTNYYDPHYTLYWGPGIDVEHDCMHIVIGGSAHI